MRFTKVLFAAAFLMFLEMFPVAKAHAQISARTVPGFVHLKFQNGALNRFGTRLELNDINSTLMRQFLTSRGFKGGSKIF